MHKTFQVKVKPGSWLCSCGEGETDLLTGAQAQRHGYWHGSYNHIDDFVLMDLRACSSLCLGKVGMGTNADEENWHHSLCPNHSIRCCTINEPEEV